MKRSTLLARSLLAAALLAIPGTVLAQASAHSSGHAGHAQAAQPSSEEAAVRAALEHYLLGHATGDGAHMRQIFHPEARLFWIREGQFSTRTSAEYIAGFSGSPAADEAQRRRWIESVDVTGNAATAKIVLDYPSARLTDYMSLLRIDGEWKIVNKIFTSEPKAR